MTVAKGLQFLPPEPFIEWLRRRVNLHGVEYVSRRVELPEKRIFKYLREGRHNNFNIDFVDSVLVREETHLWELYGDLYFDS
jgi:hypothetical protein